VIDVAGAGVDFGADSKYGGDEFRRSIAELDADMADAAPGTGNACEIPGGDR